MFPRALIGLIIVRGRAARACPAVSCRVAGTETMINSEGGGGFPLRSSCVA